MKVSVRVCYSIMNHKFLVSLAHFGKIIVFFSVENVDQNESDVSVDQISSGRASK